MNIHRQTNPWLLILLCLTLIGVRPVLAQGVQVTSADPATAEQDTVNLNVTIRGKGFKQGATVRFLVVGSQNPGGVVVNNSQFVSPKKLIANIDIDKFAVVANFDVEIELQSGRRGKGTVFSVVEKGTGNPGQGNQSINAEASFSGEIMSNMALQGEFIDNGGFDTLAGQLAMGETITVTGDAGEALAVLGSSVLPAQGVVIQPRMVSFDVNSGVSWTIRLDRDKQPEDRVQLRMRWVNGAGLTHHLRIGWVVGAYPGEKYPLDDIDYGKVPDGVTSLESTTVTFETDLFRIDGDVEVPHKGKKTKTELEVFSIYGELYDASVAPWCAMGGLLGDTCRESTSIQTDLIN